MVFPKIAYIMSRFPNLTETFILREMVELENRGWQISLYPLICQDQPVVHPDALRWQKKAVCCSFFSSIVLRTNLAVFIKHPLRYLGIFLRALLGNIRSLNFLVRTFALFPKAVFFSERMQAEGIEHIHAHYATHSSLVAWIIHQFTGIPYSTTVHAHDIFERQTFLGPKLKDAEFVAAISEFNRQYLAGVLGPWILEKTVVIHCGILPEKYTLRTVRPPDASGFQVLNIGSLEPYKGQPYLIRACRILRDRNVPIQLKIIGRGEDQAMLQKLIQETGLEDCVELLGGKTQEEVASLLRQAHCYIQPSIIAANGKMEGIPVALMEAMATGLPVIATSISGIPELVQDGVTGLLAPPANAQALADALEKVYRDYAYALSLAECGREKVYAEFDLRKNVTLLEKQLSQQMMQNPGSA